MTKKWREQFRKLHWQLWEAIGAFRSSSEMSSAAMDAVVGVETTVDNIIDAAIQASKTEHVLHSCADEGCPICNGGLGSCDVCGGAEASLLPTCPGYQLTWDAVEAVANHIITTVDDLRPEHRSLPLMMPGEYRARHGDVRGGKWLRAVLAENDDVSITVAPEELSQGKIRMYIWEGWTFDALPDPCYHLVKGDAVAIWDPEPGCRPDGTPVVGDGPWVPGRVEFVCGFDRGFAGNVSVYCDDGRGRRCVAPHLVRRRVSQGRTPEQEIKTLKREVLVERNAADLNGKALTSMMRLAKDIVEGRLAGDEMMNTLKERLRVSC